MSIALLKPEYQKPGFPIQSANEKWAEFMSTSDLIKVGSCNLSLNIGATVTLTSHTVI